MNIYGQDKKVREKGLQSTKKCSTLATVRDSLVVCPNCRQKTSQAIRPDTKASNLTLWCRRCKAAYLVDIADGQCYVISRCR